MPTTDREVPQVVVNKLTQAQYDAATKSQDEFYLVTDAPNLVEMSYGEANAWQKFIDAYNAGSIVYCRASSNANPATGTQGRKAFMAYVNNATSPTEVEFQYVRSVSSKTDSQQSDQVFVYKLTNASGGTWTVESRNMATKINVSGPITKTFTTGANATVEIGANAMTGATSGTAGTAGVVPAPAAGDQDKYLKGDGTWAAAGGATIFYTDQDLETVTTPKTYFTLYKDVSLTTSATAQEVCDAVVSGPVILFQTTLPMEYMVIAAYNDDVISYGRDPNDWDASLDNVQIFYINPFNKRAFELIIGSGQWAVYDTYSFAPPTIVQTTGQSTTSVMSQKAVTDIIGNVETILQTLNSGNGAQ